MLPESYELSSHLTIGINPVTSGGHSGVYEGFLGGSKVCVKRTRVYTKEGPEKATRVCYKRFHFPRLCRRLRNYQTF